MCTKTLFYMFICTHMRCTKKTKIREKQKNKQKTTKQKTKKTEKEKIRLWASV